MNIPMNKIIAPIILNDTSPEVSDLQLALNKLGFDQINGDEMNRPLFGATTCRALTAFKERFHIKNSRCLVESRTAAAINDRLNQLGLQEPELLIASPLVFGMNSEKISALQKALRLIGFGAGIDPAENSIFGKTTCEAIVAFQREMGMEVISCYVDNETADKINALLESSSNGQAPQMNTDRYAVSGFVIDSNGEPVDQQPVAVYDIDLTGSAVYRKAETITELTSKGGVQPLGNGVSNADGFYRVEFARATFRTDEPTDHDTADVVALAVNGEEIIGRSPLSKRRDYEANELKKWDIHLLPVNKRRRSPEYIFVEKAITQYLDSQLTKVQPWQISMNADMLEFLADELAISNDKVDAFTGADFLIHDATSPGEELPAFASQWPAAREFLYGLARQSIKLDWQILSTTSTTSINRYISESSEANIISQQEEQNVASFAEALHAFATKKMLNQSASLKTTLSIALNQEELIERFHTAYTNRSLSPGEFWDALAHDDQLKEAIPALKLTNQLSALTGNHASLMTRLAPLAQGDAVKLLELSDEDWKSAIGTDFPSFVTGESDDEKSSRYRNYMRGKLHAAFYNEKVSLMARKEEEIRIADATLRDMISQFLSSTKFDLRQNRLHDKMKDSEDTFQQKLDEIGGDRKVELKESLNKVQRVFQFSPSPEVMTKLLEAGIDSATMIVSMPFATFKAKYKAVGDNDTLLAIYQRATHIVSMIEFSILSLNRFSQSARISAIGGIK